MDELNRAKELQKRRRMVLEIWKISLSHEIERKKKKLKSCFDSLRPEDSLGLKSFHSEEKLLFWLTKPWIPFG